MNPFDYLIRCTILHGYPINNLICLVFDDTFSIRPLVENTGYYNAQLQQQ